MEPPVQYYSYVPIFETFIPWKMMGMKWGVPVKFHGFSIGFPMIFHGFSTVFHSFPWVFDGFPVFPCVFHWFSIVFHGFSMVFYGFPRVFHGFPQVSMDQRLVDQGCAYGTPRMPRCRTTRTGPPASCIGASAQHGAR